MKPYRIDSDVFFVQRQAWIADLQAKWQPVDFRLLAGVVTLGVLLTFILLAW